MTVKALPNLVSVLRFLLVPVTVWLIVEGMLGTAFWIFIAAGVTDALDGFLARVLEAHTELGQYLDPLADKALLVATYVTLAATGDLPSWLVILVVFRDVLIIGGFVMFSLMFGHFVVRPLFVSKANTLAQIVLAGLVLGGPALRLDVAAPVGIMIWIVAATTVASGLAYLHAWGRRAMAGEDGGEDGRSAP